MTTAQQNASAGVYVSDDVGLEVTDGTQSRVQLGLLPVGVNNYGLRVVAADGTTVIIDGTSDVFKIAATGTDNFTIAGVATLTSPQNNVTHVITLTGLGTFSVQQAFLGYVSTASSPTTGVTIGSLAGTGGGGNHFVSTVSTGFTAVSEGGNDTWTAYWTSALDTTAPSYLDIIFAGSNWLTTSVSAYGRYYIMIEAAQ